MKVSVIIPTYNRAAYLGSALRSLFAQSYKNFEVIVVDDGSTDNTKDIIAAFSDPRLKYFYIPNGGPSRARNYGIRQTDGEAIAFLDSDDCWDSDKLEKQVDILTTSPKVGLVFSDYRYISERGTVVMDSALRSRYPELVPGIEMMHILEDCPITTDTAMIRRSVLEKAGYFDEELIYAEDFDLWIRILLVSSIYFISRPMTSYRLHNEQLTRLSRQETWIGCVKVVKKNAQALKKQNISVSNILAKFYGLAGNAALLEKDRMKALYFFLAAFFLKPFASAPFKGVLKAFMPLTLVRRRYFEYMQQSGKSKFLTPYY